MAVAIFWGLCLVYGRCHILRIVIAVAIDILSRHAKRRTSLRISEA